MIIISSPNQDHIPALLKLYKLVSQSLKGIARTEEEITESYIKSLFQHTSNGGIFLIGIAPDTQQIIAAIHATKYGLKIFDHILTGITLVVHPDFQGKGIGKQIFSAFLEKVKEEHSHIRRVELESRSSNQKSIGLYQSLGFMLEGRMKNKTRNRDGSFEDSLLMAWENPNYKLDCN